jgi:hypothetical protein
VGYHVSIIRTSASHSMPISHAEVVAVPERVPGWEYSEEKKALISEAEHGAVLWFSDGELWTKNPKEEVLTAMITVASVLGARVRGDELETYRTANDWYVHPDDTQHQAKDADSTARGRTRQARGQRWTSRALTVIGFALLTLLLIKLGWLH